MEIDKILGYFTEENLKKFINLVMGISLIFLLDIFIVVAISHFVDVFLVLSFFSFLSLVIFFIASSNLKKSLLLLKNSFKEGKIPEENFYAFFGTIFCFILLIIPGFLSSIIGISFFHKSLKRKIGIKLLKFLKIDIFELYEYMKLYELSI